MTTTPNEPVSDDDIETAGLGSAAAPGATGPGDGTRDGAEGGSLDPQDGSDADSGDADGSDGSRDGAEGGPLDTADETDADSGDA